MKSLYEYIIKEGKDSYIDTAVGYLYDFLKENGLDIDKISKMDSTEFDDYAEENPKYKKYSNVVMALFRLEDRQ